MQVIAKTYPRSAALFSRILLFSFCFFLSSFTCPFDSDLLFLGAGETLLAKSSVEQHNIFNVNVHTARYRIYVNT